MFGLKERVKYKHPVRQEPKENLREEMKRRKSHYKRILELLQYKGYATTAELGKITFRYSARLGEMRKDGYRIVAVYQSPGLYVYKYLGHRDD